MKELALEYLHLDIIKEDDFFNISSHRAENICKILDEAGEIISPLWVLKTSNGIILVDGYSRFRWAKSRNIPNIPCIIFPESISTLDMLIKKITSTSLVRSFDIIEKANIVSRLYKFLTPTEIKEKFFEQLKIPRKSRMLKTLLKVADISEEVSKYTGVLCDKAIMKLVWWDTESMMAAFDMFHALRCSVSIQMEIIELIEDISRLREEPPHLIIRNRLKEIWTDKIDFRLKTRKIRDLLKKELFPKLSEKEKLFNNFIKSQNLPGNVKIEHPPFFEGDLWKVSISFSETSELKKHLEGLSSYRFIEGLSKIID